MNATTNHKEPAAGGSTLAGDDTIRLTWREKLVEFGLIMGLITSGMVVAAVVLVCVLFLLHDTVEKITPVLLGERPVTIVILIIISAVIGNACAYFSYPYLIRVIYRGYELNDVRIDRTLKRLQLVSGMDFRAEKIYAIRGRTANAAISGLLRKTQFIFFTDKLLERINEEEIMAVFAHELAHARHKHLPRMFLAVILWLCIVQAALYAINVNAYIETLDESMRMWAAGGLSAASIYLLLLLVLFPLSRRHEYQADATAARWVGIHRYKQALHRLYQLNDSLKPQRKIVKKLLTHPTLQDRLDRVDSWGGGLNFTDS